MNPLRVKPYQATRTTIDCHKVRYQCKRYIDNVQWQLTLLDSAIYRSPARSFQVRNFLGLADVGCLPSIIVNMRTLHS